MLRDENAVRENDDTAESAAEYRVGTFISSLLDAAIWACRKQGILNSQKSIFMMIISLQEGELISRDTKY